MTIKSDDTSTPEQQNHLVLAIHLDGDARSKQHKPSFHETRTPKIDINKVDRSMTVKESFSFSIPDYYIKHQTDAIIDIKVNYTHKKNNKNDPSIYYEFQQIIKHIEKYLQKYPNKNDPWELLNKNLVKNLLTKKFPRNGKHITD